ncbi:hypothetical protein LRAMOSA09603 [Lichtheimia ramosa]|uniref:Major facilitator superfamily (MFS) profile domain-containing protein n=1 Tax=Lichtheimia ramosa TaxID=688394 RepID=A0A077WIC5_9FUNG|nr:hypothetical protein LRAMOSA09603 [Lichtheimia ramosa]
MNVLATTRSNIANAKLGGLEEDLGLTPVQYRWCLSIIYVGIILFEIPSTIILRKWKASIWISMMAIAWGGVTMCMAATTNFAGLFVCRLFMGFFEAAFAVGGLLAFGIFEISSDRLNTWQWLFIIEGIPPMLLAVIALWCLPRRPADAKFLSDEERKLQIERFTKDQGSIDFGQKYSWDDTKQLFKDWKPYLFSYMMIIFIATGTGFSLTLPSIVHGMGTWSPAVSQALVIPPNLCACILTVAVGYSSDRFLDRSLHAVIFSLLTVAGLFMLMFLPEDQLGARYFAVCLTSSTSNAAGSVAMSWIPGSFGTFTRRAVALAMTGSIGHLGGVIGPQFYYDGPRYFHGYTIAVCLVISNIIVTLLMRFLLWRENGKRDNMTLEEKQHIIEKYDLKESGDDRHPDFRFVL